MSRPKQTERRKLWRQRVAQQKSSGQTVRAFCRENKLSECSFYQWRRQLGTADTAVRFALVEATKPGTGQGRLAGESTLELVLRSGEQLRIPSEPATLRMVLSVIRQQE